MSGIAPADLLPSGCSQSVAWKLNIEVRNVTTATITAFRRSLTARQDNVLLLALTDGVLTDQQERTGYVSASGQFQFDARPQSGALYTAGFSACTNGSLALGGSAVWYSCLSGDFYNLYYRDQSAGECNAVNIQILAVDAGGSSATASQSAGVGSSSSAALSAVSRTLVLDASGTTTSAATGSTLQVTSSSGIAVPSTTDSAQSTPSQNSQDTGSLSTGARAGIGVGVAVIAFALLCVGIVFLRRRRRNRLQIRASTPPYATHESDNDKAGGRGLVYEKDGRERKAEIDGAEVYEADGRGKNYGSQGSGTHEDS